MSSPRNRFARLVACFGAAALLAAPALAGDQKTDAPDLDIRVEGADGGAVHLSFSGDWLGGLIESLHVSCRVDADRRTRAMMESLDAGGEGAVYEFTEDDGDRVVARRLRGLLVLETRERDGDRATVEMPWPTARCLLQGVAPEGDLGHRVAEGKARLRLDVSDHDGRVRIRLD